MNSQQENEIWRLIKKAEREWGEDMKLYKEDPIGKYEPVYYDYLTREIYKYKYEKN